MYVLTVLLCEREQIENMRKQQPEKTNELPKFHEMLGRVSRGGGRGGRILIYSQYF